jgi:hypothetical protein
MVLQAHGRSADTVDKDAVESLAQARGDLRQVGKVVAMKR